MLLLMATWVATAVLMAVVFWIIRPHVETLLADALWSEAEALPDGPHAGHRHPPSMTGLSA